MMTQQQIDKFNRLCYNFLKEENIQKDNKDFNKLLRSLIINISTKHYSEKCNVDKKDNEDFIELHKHIVSEIITFVVDHPNIKQIIELKQNELSEEWNKEINEEHLKIYPDVQCYLRIDGLDDSIKQNIWSPGTDSSFNLVVGNNNIISSY